MALGGGAAPQHALGEALGDRADQQGRLPEQRDGFEPDRRDLHLGLAGDRIARIRNQHADHRLAGEAVIPMDRRENLAAALAGIERDRQGHFPALGHHPRPIPVIEAVFGAVGGMDRENRLGQMPGQAGRGPGAAHRVPLIAVASGVQQQRPVGRHRAFRVADRRGDETGAAVGMIEIAVAEQARAAERPLHRAQRVVISPGQIGDVEIPRPIVFEAG